MDEEVRVREEGWQIKCERGGERGLKWARLWSGSGSGSGKILRILWIRIRFRNTVRTTHQWACSWGWPQTPPLEYIEHWISCFVKNEKQFSGKPSFILGEVSKLGDAHDPGMGLAVVLLNPLQVILKILALKVSLRWNSCSSRDPTKRLMKNDDDKLIA